MLAGIVLSLPRLADSSFFIKSKEGGLCHEG